MPPKKDPERVDTDIPIQSENLELTNGFNSISTNRADSKLLIKV